MDSKTERARKIAALAGQLRAAYANAVDETPADRLEYVQEVLKRELSGMPPDERDTIVHELLTHFPTLEASDAPPPMPRADGVRAEALPTDPVQLTELLVKSAGRLGEAERAQITARLHSAGLIDAAPAAVAGGSGSGAGGGSGSGSGGAAGVPEGVARLIRTKLSIGEREPVDPARLMELSGALVEFMLSLDRLVWQAWGNVGPGSAVKRRELFQRTAAQFVMGNQEVALPNVTQDTDRLRQLTLAMVAAISKSGSMFAQRWLEKYGVEAIRAAAAPRKKLTESFDATCWKLYAELAGNLDQSQISDQINQTIAEFVEGLMKAGR